MKWITVLDIFGTIVFSISGWLSASQKKLDYFGGIIIAIVTAVGGGSVRDIILGNTPVGWIKNPTTIYAITFGVLLSVVFYRWLSKLRSALFLFDTLGIAVFTISGLQLSLHYDIHPIPAVLLGVLSAVAGGIIRDTLNNEIPLVFRKEIYATACLAGAMVYLGLTELNFTEITATIAGLVTIVALRSFAVWKKWSLPPLRQINF